MRSILWYDLETFGINSRYDNIAQFAAIRTNENLEVIEEPIEFFCKPTLDKLPSPEACLVTNITPDTVTTGLSEFEFTKKIYKLMLKKNTCIAGYNSIKFDDEFIRHLFYRNFCNPYIREYANNNSRWDILDIARVTYALRPEGIKWPLNEQNKVSFRLEDLTKANHIEHDFAHNALSDVFATIAIAKLIKDKQPKIFNYFYNLRSKNNIKKLIDLKTPTPVAHISPFYGFESKYLKVVLPLFVGSNPNEIIACDSNKKFIKIAINKCPVVAPISVITKENEKDLNFDLEQLKIDFNEIFANKSELEKEFRASEAEFEEIPDPEYQLYNSFINNDDNDLCKTFINLAPKEMLDFNEKFFDPRLNELLFRFKARNFFDLFSESDKQSWFKYCNQRLTANYKNELSIDQYFAKIQYLKEENNSPEKLKVLSSLESYGKHIVDLLKIKT